MLQLWRSRMEPGLLPDTARGSRTEMLHGHILMGLLQPAFRCAAPSLGRERAFLQKLLVCFKKKNKKSGYVLGNRVICTPE